MVSSLWEKFRIFVKENIGNDIADSLDHPLKDTPDYICAWIFAECDTAERVGKAKMAYVGKTYSHALKMRAAISFHYNGLGRGATNWHMGRFEVWDGNPSLSTTVSRYMISLQKRKVISRDFYEIVPNDLQEVLKFKADRCCRLEQERLPKAPSQLTQTLSKDSTITTFNTPYIAWERHRSFRTTRIVGVVGDSEGCFNAYMQSLFCAFYDLMKCSRYKRIIWR